MTIWGGAPVRVPNPGLDPTPALTSALKVATSRSDCSSATKRGDLGRFEKGKMMPAFESATAALSVGEISGNLPNQYPNAVLHEYAHRHMHTRTRTLSPLTHTHTQLEHTTARSPSPSPHYHL